MSSKFASDGIGSTDRQTDRTKWSARLSRALLIPCIALTAATLQQSQVQAQSRFEHRIQKRRLQEESKLTDTQKLQLFEVRRDWALSSYDKRRALLKSGLVPRGIRLQKHGRVWPDYFVLAAAVMLRGRANGRWWVGIWVDVCACVVG